MFILIIVLIYNDNYFGYASYKETISVGGSSAITNGVFMSVEAYPDDET